MTEHFDAVVIGSGFGGAVMSYRLAEAGLRVCLLERGKAFPPNSFPRDPYGIRNNFWDPSNGLYGMFNVWSFKGSGALVSSGLGGGSLIYANILIRKDEKWFVNQKPGDRCYEQWPVTRAMLEEHYGRVERMMNAQKYPLKHEPYKGTQKTLAMQEAARKLNPDGKPGLEWLPLNLAVSFRTRAVAHPDDDDPSNPPLVGVALEEEHPNYHTAKAGRLMQRSTCRLCGECDIGCNFGSKNTLDYNYISEAHRLGAEVRTLCEVKRIAPRQGGGYSVSYIVHDLSHEGQKVDTDDIRFCPKHTVTCDRLVLAAGTFATPYLLFKSGDAFPNLSKRLGTRFSVNGDLLSFITKATMKRDGRVVPRDLNPSFGPVITGAIRFGDTLDGNGDLGRGFYVEDGGNPYLLSWAAELSGAFGLIWRTLHFLKLRVKYLWGLSQDTDLAEEIASVLGDAVVSRSSLPVLTMGRDCPDGRLRLNGRYLDCDWAEKAGSKEYYKRVVREVTRIAEALGADYMDNPAYKKLNQVLTAHPLGGAPMGTSAEDGVVDSYGEVFNYPGLYIADGSMLPGPVGPNPSLTIGALSDRFADHIIDQHKGVTR
ncbi:MAG TPA: GMC family oxidoreductase [Pyrinomonadaceae bacterium]|nr:GMC family oxidoreductase [Pyrinomonadaceae bacterium]